MSNITMKFKTFAACSILSAVVVMCIGCQRKNSCNECEPCVTEYCSPCVYEFQFQRCPTLVCCPQIEEEENDYFEGWNEEYLYIEEGPPPLHYQPSVPEYRVAVGDVLEISVFDEDETMMANVSVAPDGKIYYLFLEGIDARGKTIPELKQAMSQQLTNLFINPTVSIIPRLMLRDSFTILGRVKTPGIYPLTQQVTVRQAIGVAGGLMTEEVPGGGGGRMHRDMAVHQAVGRHDLSNLRDSFLVRDGKRLPVDFVKLVYSGDISQDIPLHAGDYLYIAPNDQRDVYVLGDGVHSQAVNYMSGMTLIGSLATAGGWIDDGPYGADITRVIVLRGALDCPEYIVVDLKAILCGSARDVYLEPGDVIYVHHKPYRFVRELIELAVNTFMSSFGNTAGNFCADKLFLGDNL